MFVIRNLQRLLPGVFAEVDHLWTESVVAWSKC